MKNQSRRAVASADGVVLSSIAGENEGVDVQLDGLIDDEAQRMALVVDQRITVEVFADV